MKGLGVETVAARFRAAALQDTAFGQRALKMLSESFGSYEHTGPVGWVTESGFDGDDRIREAREAAGIVQEFVRLVQS